MQKLTLEEVKKINGGLDLIENNYYVYFWYTNNGYSGGFKGPYATLPEAETEMEECANSIFASGYATKIEAEFQILQNGSLVDVEKKTYQPVDPVFSAIKR